MARGRGLQNIILANLGQLSIKTIIVISYNPENKTTNYESIQVEINESMAEEKGPPYSTNT